MKPMLASPAGPVIPFPMLLSPKLDGIAKAVYHGSKGENGMKNIDDEILFKLVKDHLNKIYHKRKDKIIHAGTGLTQPAQWYRDFAKAVIAEAQKQRDIDAECFRFWVSEAARSPAAMANLIMNCTTEDEYRAAIIPCIEARESAIAKATGAESSDAQAEKGEQP